MSAKKGDKNKEKNKEKDINLKDELSEEKNDDKSLNQETICEECQKWSDKYDELSDKYMRIAAEYDNFRRRSQKEKSGIYSESVTDVTKAWLPVIDNLERAIGITEKYQSDDAKKIAQGVEMILTQSKEVMESLGVKEIDALNSKFDPNTMEAVMHVQDEGADESQVIEVFEKGYIRGDKVIRHAMVKVAN